MHISLVLHEPKYQISFLKDPGLKPGGCDSGAGLVGKSPSELLLRHAIRPTSQEHPDAPPLNKGDK